MKKAVSNLHAKPPRWKRWAMLAWALALVGWLIVLRIRERPERAGEELRALVAADSRFAGVTVGVKTNSDISVLAPDTLPAAARADLERLVAQHAAGLKFEVGYVRPIDKATPGPPEPLSGDTFLGLRDNETRKIGDSTPESAVGFVTNLTEVSERDYADYQTALARGEVKAHGTRAGYMYYATEIGRDVPFANGSSAWVFITERHKAKLPGR